MRYKESEKLLEKYYEGETSLIEEQQLKEFLSRDDVPAHLLHDAAQFRYYAASAGEKLNNPLFDEYVNEKIGEVRVIPMRSGIKRFYSFIAVAATMLILIGLFFTFREDIFRKDKYAVTPASAELAYVQTKDILMVVSANFNNGLDKMQYLEQYDKAIGKVQMLSKFYEYQSLIINPDEMQNTSKKSE